MDLASISSTAMSAILSLVAFQEIHGGSAQLTQAYDHLSNFYFGVEDMRVVDSMATTI